MTKSRQNQLIDSARDAHDEQAVITKTTHIATYLAT